MPTKTLSELRDEVRNRGEFRDPYITDSEMNGYINDSIAALWDLVVLADDSRHLPTANITVTSGTSSYSLPDDFYLLKGVDVVDSSAPTGYRTLRRYNHDERNDYPQNAEKTATYYDVFNNKLTLVPTPSWSGTVRIHYIETPTKLTADSDTFETVNSWSEYVILDALIKCALKEDTSPTAWERRLQRVTERILSVATVDRNEPKTVTNIYRVRNRRNDRYLPWER